MAESSDDHTGGHRHMQPNQNVLAYDTSGHGPPRDLGDCKKRAGGVGHVPVHGHGGRYYNKGKHGVNWDCARLAVPVA